MSWPSSRMRARGRLDQAQDGAADGGLAAAGLADEAERLARADREAHAVDGVDMADGAAQAAPCGPGNASSARRPASDGRGARLRASLCSHAPLRQLVGVPAGGPMARLAFPRSGGYSRAARVARRTDSAARRRSPAAGCISGGTMPGISCSRSAAVVAVAAHQGEPRDRGHQAARVGMQRLREQVLDRRLLDLAAGIHHDDALGGLGHHAEVVRDQDHGGAELAAAARRSARGSAPGSSRRARWSARRRSAPWDCRPAPWRSWRAGACRRRADADIPSTPLLAARGCRRGCSISIGPRLRPPRATGSGAASAPR